MHPWEAVKAISAGDIRPFYLLFGSEAYLISELVSALRRHIVVAETEAFNYHAVDWSPGRLTQVLSVAQTLPFFAERRLVVLRDCPLFGRRGKEAERDGADAPAEGESASRDDRREPAPAKGGSRGRVGDTGGEDGDAALTAYLERPAAFTCLVITAAAVDTRRRLFKAARAAGEAIECRNLTEDEATGWCQRQAGSLGKSLDGATARQLVAKAGTDLHRLTAELEKLALYVGDRRSIHLEEVDVLVSGTAPGEVFDMLDAVGRRRMGDALTLLHKFLRRGDPGPVILAAIARHLRMLILARAYATRGANADQAAAARGQHPFYWKKLMEQARNFGRGELVTAMSTLLQADLALKTGQEATQVLQSVLIQLGNREHVASTRRPLPR